MHPAARLQAAQPPRSGRRARQLEGHRRHWCAHVGETAFDLYNQKHFLLLEGNERFYIETKVSVGEINGQEITGSCDLYDRVTGTVIDHKTCGPTILNSYRRKRDPGDQCRVKLIYMDVAGSRRTSSIGSWLRSFPQRRGWMRLTYGTRRTTSRLRSMLSNASTEFSKRLATSVLLPLSCYRQPMRTAHDASSSETNQLILKGDAQETQQAESMHR